MNSKNSQKVYSVILSFDYGDRGCDTRDSLQVGVYTDKAKALAVMKKTAEEERLYVIRELEFSPKDISIERKAPNKLAIISINEIDFGTYSWVYLFEGNLN